MRAIYLIAAIEGFSTLAMEIIALRLAAPVTGSSSIVTSVFLGVILLGLSIGYRWGGNMASKLSASQIRKRLLMLLTISGLWYGVISFGSEVYVLERLLDLSGSYVGTLFMTAFSLFFIPVVLASQTIPLLAELIDDGSAGKAAGKMLFASTIGSFLGSVGTSIFLFQRWGVTTTGVVVSAVLLASGALVLGRKYWRWAILWLVGTCLGAWVLLSYRIPTSDQILYDMDSAYQHIRIVERRGLRFFLANGAYASAFSPMTQTSPFRYIREAVTQTRRLAPQRVLVIGTAGFTYPYEISDLPSVQHIDAVDVDPVVKEVAEDYFLQTDLPDKIHFYPQSARRYIHQAIDQHKTYDIIFVDAFQGKSLPDELTTQEFFVGLQSLLAEDGVLMVNAILDRDLETDLAQSLLATVQDVFGAAWIRQTTQNDTLQIENFILATRPLDSSYVPTTANGTIYTDDRRSTELDTVKMYWD